MAATTISFTLGGLGQAPDADDALHYGRALAARSGTTLPDDARPRITQVDGGFGIYRVEIPLGSNPVPAEAAACDHNCSCGHMQADHSTGGY